MVAVVDHEARVEAQLVAGGLFCPGCEAPLRPWGWARRRPVRFLDGPRPVRPRRARCEGCGSTHVLVPTSTLLRRADAAEVIGAALVATMAGAGHRQIAARLGRCSGTVRNWLRRFAARAEHSRAEATRWAYRLDPSLGAIEPQASPVADAMVALNVAAVAATACLGPASCPWQVVSALSGARLLSPG